jgi:hypothetical protein
MAWTAPITFISGTTLTASQLNTYLRDNLLELAPAKATTPGSYFCATGTNSIAERTPDTNLITTSQTTTSTSYVDLATVGPSVSVATGAYAFVIATCQMENNTNDFQTYMSWAVSGATTRSAIDAVAVGKDGTPAGNFCRLTNFDMINNLTPGTNTFTAKYRVGGGTGTFSERRITVFPF